MHNMSKYCPKCILCVKNTKGAQNQFFKKFWAVANTAIIHGRVSWPCSLVVLEKQAHGQIHGRVSGRVATAVHQKYAFFDAATLATKATTFVTMHIHNYNIYN